jgi:hypothetical protein
MKKVVLLMVSVLVLGSCQKIKDELLSSEMTATLDGSDWVANKRVTTLKDNIFTINGNAADGTSLSIIIDGSDEGVYSINILEPKNCTAIYKETLSSTSEDAFVALRGEATVTEINTSKKEISGTFSFVFKKAELSFSADSVIVTNGVFKNLNYLEQD